MGEFGLDRFVEAQADTFKTALDEIRKGEKRSHWIWFIFPQLAGLGHSAMAERYAIRSIDEARAFLHHPVLGPRYRQCVEALQDLAPVTAETVFGAIDAMKLRSSLTLFAETGVHPMFDAAIERWFAGQKDEATLRLLSSGVDQANSGYPAAAASRPSVTSGS